jgi:hypothetical protein
MAENNKDLETQDEFQGNENLISRPSDDADLTETEEQLLHLQSLISIDPSIEESPEYQRLLETVEKVRANGGSATDEEEEDEDEEEEDNKDDSNEFGIDSNEDDDTEEIEVPEELADFIEEKYSIKDVNKFFDSVDTWRKQSQEGAKIRDQYEEIVEGLQSLPDDIKAAIDAFAGGKDYKQAFTENTSLVNFREDIEKQDREDVVSHYFKDKYAKLKTKYEEGDLDEDDFEDRVSDLYDSAKKLFNVDKERFEKQRAELMKQQEELAGKFKQSAVSSVERLQQEYPNFSRQELQKVRTRLVKGDIDSIFKNPDGTYKDDAAELISFALYGKRVIQELLESAERRGESKANEEIVRRGSRSMRSSKSQSGKQSKEAIDAVSHLGSAFQQDPYS